jgi:basic membrane lipoprotein Med (substrate-binding protein (PBP1-ABC) superfamily)
MKTTYIAAVLIVIVAIIAGGAYYYTTMNQPTQTVKIGAIFVTPLDEPWNHVLYVALLRANTELGVNFTYVESVSESQEPGVAVNLINSGYNLIIPDSWGFWNSTDNLGPQYPNVYFGAGSGLNVNFGHNLMLFDSYLQEADYIAGYVAANISNTGKLGIVTVPFFAGDVYDECNGFIAGAKAYNPNINITLAYVSGWYVPSEAKSAAQALIASGCDVIFGEREGVFEACVQNDVQIATAIGHFYDATKNAENSMILGAVVWNNYPMLRQMIVGAEYGNFSAGIYYATLKNNDTYFSWNPTYITRYPTAYANAQTLVQSIIAGNVFWGNINVTLINGTVVNGNNIPLSVPNFSTPSP